MKIETFLKKLLSLGLCLLLAMTVLVGDAVAVEVSGASFLSAEKFRDHGL